MPYKHVSAHIQEMHDLHSGKMCSVIWTGSRAFGGVRISVCASPRIFQVANFLLRRHFFGDVHPGMRLASKEVRPEDV